MRRVLALDPGALRLGWSVLERGEEQYRYIASGIKGLDREEDEPFQQYRNRLLRYWIEQTPELLGRWEPDLVAAELLPAVGGGNFVAATQSELAKTALLVIEITAMRMGLPVQRLAANSIKKSLTGNGRATKAKVRDAVLEVFPELLPRKRDLTTVADEADAIGTGLVALGYKHNGRNTRRT